MVLHSDAHQGIIARVREEAWKEAAMVVVRFVSHEWHIKKVSILHGQVRVRWHVPACCLGA